MVENQRVTANDDAQWDDVGGHDVSSGDCLEPRGARPLVDAVHVIPRWLSGELELAIDDERCAHHEGG